MTTTSSERDELAVTITLSLDATYGNHNGIPAVQDYELADAILAAGYRKPTHNDKDAA